jgi:magnesium-transporting ATPase (P-type)
MLQRESESATALVPAPWSIDKARVLETLEVRPSTGLMAQEVQEHRERFGPNMLEEFRAVSWITILFRQLRSFVVYLLS